MSWFDQLDFSSIQDELAKSLEEASAVISTVNRLDLLNLDELAIQQEEEEKQRALEEANEEEEEEHEEHEVLPFSLPAQDAQEQPNKDTDSLNLDNFNVSVTENTGSMELTSDIEAAVVNSETDQLPLLNSPPPRPLTIIKSADVKERKKKKMSKMSKDLKKKRKKKHLDFFGIRSAAPEEEEEDHQEEEMHVQSDNKETSKPAELAFDISFLWDGEGYMEEIPIEETALANNNNITSPDPPSGSNSNFIADMISASSNALRVPSNIIIEGSKAFSFFSDVDKEVDLENDPILKKVEENKLQVSQGISLSNTTSADYFSYIRSLTSPYSSNQKNTTSISAGSSQHISTQSISSSSYSSNSNEEVSCSSLSYSLLENIKTSSRSFVEKSQTAYQQLLAVSQVCQVNYVGSIMLHTASILYIVMQFLLGIVVYIGSLLVCIGMYIIEVIVMVSRLVLNRRQERLELPCSMQNFQQRRQWVRDNVGSWANRMCQGQIYRANYLVGIAVGVVLVLTFWEVQEYLDID